MMSPIRHVSLNSPCTEEEKDVDPQEIVFETIELDLKRSETRMDSTASNAAASGKIAVVSPYVTESLDFCRNLIWCGALGAVVVALFILVSIVIRYFFL